MAAASSSDQTLADWQWVLGVNLWGVIHGLHSFVPILLANPDGGHVVNTASVAGLLAGAGIGPYNASKFAVVAISETLRKELDMSDAQVGVSVLCPGYVRTNIFESQRNRPEALRNGRGRRATPASRTSVSSSFLEIAMDPAEVAAMVHDAIIEDRFWMITHPEFLKAVSERADDLVAGKTLARADSANDAESTTRQLGRPSCFASLSPSCSLSAIVFTLAACGDDSGSIHGRATSGQLGLRRARRELRRPRHGCGSAGTTAVPTSRGRVVTSSAVRRRISIDARRRDSVRTAIRRAEGDYEKAKMR